MAMQSVGCACIDAGGAYVALMAHCEKLELIGTLRKGLPVEEIEFAVIAKSTLVASLKKEFTVISCNECEIIFLYYGTPVSVTTCTHQTYEHVIREAA